MERHPCPHHRQRTRLLSILLRYAGVMAVVLVVWFPAVGPPVVVLLQKQRPEPEAAEPPLAGGRALYYSCHRASESYIQ